MRNTWWNNTTTFRKIVINRDTKTQFCTIHLFSRAMSHRKHHFSPEKPTGGVQLYNNFLNSGSAGLIASIFPIPCFIYAGETRTWKMGRLPRVCDVERRGERNNITEIDRKSPRVSTFIPSRIKLRRLWECVSVWAFARLFCLCGKRKRMNVWELAMRSICRESM